jgi:ferredoxin
MLLHDGMIRQIITIDRDKCNGCGMCADACHEGAIAMVGGKAELAREDYCDGLGDCLPACPTGAISFVTRETKPFGYKPPAAGIPMAGKGPVPRIGPDGRPVQWPIKLRLVPLTAPFLNGADLIIAADCTAFVSADLRERVLKGKIVLIGCPKFDSDDYVERLAHIFSSNDIRSVAVVRMEVPCCGAMERMVKEALAEGNKDIPFNVVVLATDGTVLKA